MLPLFQTLHHRVCHLEATMSEKTKHKLHFTPGEVCPICQKKLVSAGQRGWKALVKLMPCKHVFHRDCYLNENNRIRSNVLKRCPLCQEEVSDMYNVQLKEKISAIVTLIPKHSEGLWYNPVLQEHTTNPRLQKMAKILASLEHLLSVIFRRFQQYKEDFLIEDETVQVESSIQYRNPPSLETRIDVPELGVCLFDFIPSGNVLIFVFYDKSSQNTYYFDGTLFGVQFEKGNANNVFAEFATNNDRDDSAGDHILVQ
jgi:hypothetical protein